MNMVGSTIGLKQRLLRITIDISAGVQPEIISPLSACDFSSLVISLCASRLDSEQLEILYGETTTHGTNDVINGITSGDCSDRILSHSPFNSTCSEITHNRYEDYQPNCKFDAIIFIRPSIWVPLYHLFGHARELLKGSGVIIIVDSPEELVDDPESSLQSGYMKLADRSGFRRPHPHMTVNLDGAVTAISIFERNPNKTGAYVRPYCDGDECDINKLFNTVFHKDHTKIWKWKFRHSDVNPCIFLAYQENDLVAQYAGIPRYFQYMAQPIHGIQICDIMVHPKARLQMKTDGVFSSVTKTFLEEYVGKDKRFKIAYGFPNLRHLKLAIRLGIYEEVIPLLRLRSTDLTLRPHSRSPAKKLKDYDPAVFTSVWEEMDKSFYGSVLGRRDFPYANWRYLRHPSNKYLFLGLQSRWLKKVRGIAVLVIQNNTATLIDIICPKKLIPELIGSIESYLRNHSIVTLEIMVTGGYSQLFSDGSYEITHSGIVIPRCPWQDDTYISDYKNRLFLMLGDSDLY